MLATGGVTVNGDVEDRRGRQLRDGDVVRLADRTVRVVATVPPSS
jgi:ribosome-associated protein